MRVWTKVVSRWDGTRYVTEESLSSYFEYDGAVELCKGDDVARQTELLAQQNMSNQMRFSQQLVSVFEKQFGKQSDILDYLKGKMTPIIEAGGRGYSPEALAAMRTSATDNISQQYQNAQQALQSRQFALGGRDLPSGVNEQLNAALLSSEASTQAGTQNAITLQNENLKQANYWNALNALSGVGAQFNPQSYAGAANSASSTATEAGNSVASLSQAYQSSKQSQLMGALGGLAGGVFGAAGQAGGFGSLFCFISAKIYNEDFYFGARTNLIRFYLLNDLSQHWYGRLICRLYARYGARIAQHPLLVKLLKPLFDLALRKAHARYVSPVFDYAGRA